jgi:NAD(P)H-nitrite reductase large subunit
VWTWGPSAICTAAPRAACVPVPDEKAALYKRINVSADGTRLLGAVLVGDCAD